MKKKFTKLLPYSVLLGVLVTLLFISQMHWAQQSNCVNYDSSLVNIRRVDCSGLEYGYPMKFIVSESRIDLNSLTTNKNSPILLGESSIIRFRVFNFALDVVLWSALSFVLIAMASTQYQRSSKN